ncbi:hypothetical protein IQ266_25125 [filamentous cyanobacterium LEGE 11480]|uniref:Uncharacterized protein n=1 Tax=Romeriopsis navalis LEGE 11480 TaxID=2777977 RepID=A0A928VSP1_9CYAN|nr:hypothetical protein [Romeriopsis navalis]MBE9033023.1 hypothetical protein [Romeriopsis navalis LEGE 11480]
MSTLAETPRTVREGVVYFMGNQVMRLTYDGTAYWQYQPYPAERYSIQQSVGLVLDAYLEGLPNEVRILHGYIAAEFWQQTWDNLDHSIIPKCTPRAVKDAVRLEAELWKATFDCLNALNKSGYWSLRYPAVDLGSGLFCLVQEAQLIGWWAIDCEQDKPPRVATIKAKHQSINQALKQERNPFDSNTITGEFIDCCLGNKIWRPIDEITPVYEAWQQLIKCRSAHLQQWLQSQPFALDGSSGKIIDPKVAAAKKKQWRHQNTRKDFR